VLAVPPETLGSLPGSVAAGRDREVRGAKHKSSFTFADLRRNALPGLPLPQEMFDYVNIYIQIPRFVHSFSSLLVHYSKGTIQTKSQEFHYSLKKHVKRCLQSSLRVFFYNKSSIIFQPDNSVFITEEKEGTARPRSKQLIGHSLVHFLKKLLFDPFPQ
jgi:hypothetical protein